MTAVKSTSIVAAPPRELRSVSTLKPNPDFMMAKADLRKGAMYFYNNLTSARKSAWTWCSLVTQALFPDQVQKEITQKDSAKKFAPIFKTLAKTYSDAGAKAVTAVKRDVETSCFIVRVPILAVMALPDTDLSVWTASVTRMCMDLTIDQPRLNPGLKMLDRIDLTKLKPIGNLDKNDVNNLAAANAGLYFMRIGNHQVAVLELVFTKPMVEHLMNGPFLEARSLDFYGVIRSWVDGYFGTTRKSGQFSIPLPRIAASLPKEQNARLSEDGLCIDEHGEIFWLATSEGSKNNVDRYESLAAEAYEQEDGSFSAVNFVTGKLKTPPKAMPVLIDWTNLKFAYTSNEGSLLIKHLDRVQPTDISHIVRYLNAKVTRSSQSEFLRLTFALGSFLNIPSSDYTLDKFLLELIKFASARDGAQEYDDVNLIDIYKYAQADSSGAYEETYAKPSEACLTFIQMVEAIRKFLEKDPENAFAFYSVMSVCSYMAGATIFLKYSKNFSTHVAQDRELRKPYLEQNVDPDWKLPSVPYVNANMGLMPHQYKVQNKLRHSPKLAILPVDAGGGKTPLAVYEILKEMQANKGVGLSLVFCPSHLVAQYVKEFSYFCGPRVNVIPVTTYAIRRLGYDKLEAMIKHAPPNSVIISDYYAIVFRRYSLSYGVTPIVIYPVVEFLRKFGFRYVIADESHYLKNSGQRNSSVARLFAEIPYKRLASGTMVANVLTDLVRQISVINPSLFGTTEDFIREYALETRGSKVIAWKSGAEAQIKRLMSEYICIADAKRKEWAAILPSLKESFHRVSMTEAQFEVYHAVLEQVVEKIKEKISENAELLALFNGEVDEEDLDDLDIDKLIKPYLARLEMFLNAPALDPLGKQLLKGDDTVSPKALEVIKLCQKHIADGVPGKILIFTNYGNSRDAIYDAFPDDLKAMTIKYMASKKDECGAQAERDDSKRIMIGIENSMNTGLNLQQFSRLIRVETVWTPGVLEQGNSRINRPNIKKAETREQVFIDWICVDHTIDVTKICYLMAKTISKSKFDEAGSPRFDSLVVPPLFNINLETIQEANDFDTTLVDYFDKYSAYKKAIEAEYAEYREKNKDVLLDKNGKIRLTSIERSENGEGAAMMRRVPYVPGMELYNAEQLGLVRYDEYLDLEEESDSDEEGDDAETVDAKQALEAERAKMIGMGCHTHLGDGEIIKVIKDFIIVRLPSGEDIRTRRPAAFVITKNLTSGKDVRTQLLKMTGDMPLDAPLEVLEPGIPAKPGKAGRDEGEEAEVTQLELEVTIVNDFLGLRLANVDNESAVNIAKANGFRFSPAYFATIIKRPKVMLDIFKKWGELGFTWDKSNNEACLAAYQHWKANVTTGTDFYGLAFEQDIKNFYRMEFKPNPDKTHINPYPLIQDGQLYLALPATGQPGSRSAIAKTVGIPTVRWLQYESDTELIAFVARKEKAKALVESLVNQEGIEVTNLKELVREINKLKIART